MAVCLGAPCDPTREPEMQRLQQIAALDPLPSPHPFLDESNVLRVVQRTFTVVMYINVF